ncbi:polysaccharide biosynthesis tyrosine autokinase [filamentous cyanobacterium LEGE 11480]|uniref:non-specific protein-tyrosine kinase n=1 Tax=Romeriopsis navalis LEGE 11480 TaxID=2777977 RepID=A0A928VMH2_9CYAN|nr:polysaccharide biosynthesis tyrosine autokinase [Romeriopsis navalis]MBE9030413.1 polysaccharide biosynthesis tyrosine autokinase [Romeriopsis navalis LEGE 11480]
MERDRQPEEIRFDKYWLTLKRHRFPASLMFLVVLAGAGFVASMERPTYQAEGKLLFRKRDRTATLLAEGDKGTQLEALNNQNTPIDTEAEVLQSAPLVQKVIEDLKLKDKDGDQLAPEAFLKQLSVKGVKGTDILLVAYKSGDAKEAAAIVNQLIQEYIANNIAMNRSEAAAARQFIAKQLPALSIRLEQAEINLRDFEEANEVVSLVDEAKSSVETVAELSQRVAATKSEYDNVNAQTLALRSRVQRNAQAALTLNNLNQSTGVQQAFSQVQQVEAELASQRARYRAGHPQVQILERRQQALGGVLRQRIREVLGSNQAVSRTELQVGLSEQKLIEQYINSEVNRRGLASQLNSLVQARAAYQSRATRLPRLRQQRQALERQVATLRTNHNALSRRLQEVEIAENQDLGVARVVAKATVPGLPLASKQKLILAGGSIAGALLYILTAFSLDLRDPSIKTAKEAREAFPFASLGLIPLMRQKSQFGRKVSINAVPQLPVIEHPSSLTSAAYRMLQSNLKFLNPDRRVKSIAVTSSIAKEGKSTVSANLAAALAQMGHRVLLIDVDFYRPVQHQIWGLVNNVGLSNVVMSQVQLKTVINRVQPNLDVIPAGTLPPRPLALVDSKRMSALIAAFEQQYDYVICDTPPLVLASDVIALGQKTDGVMMVVRPGIIDTNSATEAKRMLEQSNLELLGIVTNGVAVENEPDSYLKRAREYYESVSLTPSVPSAGEVPA